MALLGMNFGMRSVVSALSSGRENRSSGWLSSLLSIEGNAAEISKLGNTGFSVH